MKNIKVVQTSGDKYRSEVLGDLHSVVSV